MPEFAYWAVQITPGSDGGDFGVRIHKWSHGKPESYDLVRSTDVASAALHASIEARKMLDKGYELLDQPLLVVAGDPAVATEVYAKCIASRERAVARQKPRAQPRPSLAGSARPDGCWAW